MNHPIGRRRERKRRHIRNGLTRSLRIRDKHQHIAVSFAARVGGDADFVDVNEGAFDQRRNSPATSFLIEPPTVVGTLNTVAFHFAEGQRHPAMGANVTHGRDGAVRSFADEDWEAQQDRPFEAAGSEFATQARRIPKAKERCALGRFDLGDEVAVHEKRKEDVGGTVWNAVV